MKSSDLRRKKMGQLVKGRVKHIGLLESLKLKVIGRTDGARGLPRQETDGHWTSAFMDRERNAYEEFCSHMWATLQIDNEENYIHLNQLVNSVLQTQLLLKEAKFELAKRKAQEDTVAVVRRTGEEKLTDEQVRSRRMAEKLQRLAPLQSRITALEERVETTVAEFSEVYCKLVEDSNTTRITCHRVHDHSLQRLTYYWNAALAKHPDRAAMPTVPGMELTFRAEQTFEALHEKVMSRAQLLYEQEHIVEKEAV